MALKSSLLWQTDKGNRDLIRVNEGATTAVVIASECDAPTLRELAKAATEAAEQLEGFAADAEKVRKAK